MSRLYTAAKLITLLAAITVSAIGSVASAQSSAAVPTREEIERGVIDQTLKGQAQTLTVDGGVERSACPLASPEFADVKFTLRAVNFTGLGAIDSSILAPSFNGYVGQEVPVATVCEIRDRAATILRSSGYLAAVQVPPQTIEGGTVQFDVSARTDDVSSGSGRRRAVGEAPAKIHPETGR